MGTHSSILAWRIPMDRGTRLATLHGAAEGWTRLKRLSHTQPANSKLRMIIIDVYKEV